MTITPNQEQLEAIEKLTTWLKAPFVKDPYYVFEGPAGTGKTFCASQIIPAVTKEGHEIAVTATTNKAARVLREQVGKAKTIYSVLGLRLDSTNELKTLLDPKEALDLSCYRAVWVDEAGMAPLALMKAMKKAYDNTGVRFVFSGDPFQLPPVGERSSSVWDLPQKVCLNTVVRNDSQILNLVTSLRKGLETGILSAKIVTDNSDGKGVWKLGKDQFLRTILDQAHAGAFAKPDQVKVIAWRNAVVQKYNQAIRKVIFGNNVNTFEIGERIIAASPCLDLDDRTILSTDEEAVVLGIKISNDPRNPEFKTYELECQTNDGDRVRLMALHPDSLTFFQSECEKLRHEAFKEKYKWKNYWALKERFHDLRYAYAITAHRSQGSTYHTVFVDYFDILSNPQRQESFQCLYVAASRPTTCLYLA